ncbi:hypothetical protein CYMTET_55603 [Cymbomonas tetramitiformis]|uniref:Uncharacterized protein n=1 Tax=Cymbomonas tetramitiformis TaxID=36881 RepID=A0AAE0EN62_9CHLO|nr:hypothetical protein CYMTET_55603 [Cymbomonas tetramitiformis]
MSSNVADLQLLLDALHVQHHTAALVDAGLFVLDSSGDAFMIGQWPAASGSGLVGVNGSGGGVSTTAGAAGISGNGTVVGTGSAPPVAGSALAAAVSVATAGASGPVRGVPAGTAGATGNPSTGTAAVGGGIRSRSSGDSGCNCGSYCFSIGY